MSYSYIELDITFPLIDGLKKVEEYYNCVHYKTQIEFLFPLCGHCLGYYTIFILIRTVICKNVIF